jgi:riboflavin synthase
MFTGIIEASGAIKSIRVDGTNKIFWISSSLSRELKVDQSVSHSGVCLTIEDIKNGMHRVTAIEETLKKSNLADWREGDLVNLERCLPLNGRLDGHIVQGHVDTTAICLEKKELEGSHEYRFKFHFSFASLIIEKGSISLNGISLTLFNISLDEFSVAIIPYTFDHTDIQYVLPDSRVNLEFDMIGKYVARLMTTS